MKVIGAGFGRTGTMSLKHALEDLGFGPCYHMIELSNHPEEVRFWERVAANKTFDWENLLGRFSSTVDFPSCLYYKALMEAYPQAKVVLTTRDPEAWYKSAQATIFQSHPTPKQLFTIATSYFRSKRIRNLMRLGWLIQKLIYKRTFQFKLNNKAYCIERFLAHEQEVIASVPKEKLLVFDVKEGWAPLCAFLNVPIPSHPFPKTNRPKHFHKMKNHTLKAPVSSEMKKEY